MHGNKDSVQPKKIGGGKSSPVVRTAATTGGTGSIPDRGTEIPQAMQHGQKKKKILSDK